MNDYVKVYLEEATELLADLEEGLLELEESPEDMELIGRIFRALHTIKGSGAMFGFDRIAEFTHEVETAFDLVRNGELKVSKNLIDHSLASRDIISELLNSGEELSDESEKKQAQLIVAFQQYHKSMETALVEETHEDTHQLEAKSTAPVDLTYRIVFKPHQNIFQFGSNPLFIINELKELGETTIIADLHETPLLDTIDVEGCYCFWNVILTTHEPVEKIKEAFIFVEDLCDLSIDRIFEHDDYVSEGDFKRLGELLVDRGAIQTDELQRILGKQKKVGEILVESGAVASDDVKSALAEQKHIREVQKKKEQDKKISSIRVASDKLDLLVDLVGEMVTVQAHLSQTAVHSGDSRLMGIAEEVERLTGELRDNTMSIRMLPMGSTFGRFRRLVRDLSKDLGKEIELSTEGAETELDKTVIDRLGDPLVHLIRNSLDHGVESPEERAAIGKPRMGMIHLSAQHSGGYVLIEIMDDGKGIDKEKIFKKGVEKGLVQPDASLTDNEIYQLLFAPGFSTAAQVTNVSGRGVGMDVVKKNIEALRGKIEVESQLGVGTTITLKLPLTLAIIDGLLVCIGEGFYVIPLSLVEECIELTSKDVEQAHGRHMVNIRGEIVPYIRLRDFFGITSDPVDIEQVVIVNIDNHRIGFVVDAVEGQHETVIKSLGRVYRNVSGVSGATILGNGSVALILDAPKLASEAEYKELSSKSVS